MTIVSPPGQVTELYTEGHWRTRSGELILSVPNKNGQGEHATTLRDARVLDLLPSVTTILKIVDKPMLDEWKIETALDAYIKWPHLGKQNAIEEMRKISRDAADLGSLIHAAIEQGFRGNRLGTTDMRIAHIVRGFWQWYGTSGLSCEQAEHSFVNEVLGYTGTIDFEGTLNGEPVIIDFKTEEAEKLSDFSYHEPEYPLQLAGYDLGVGQNRKRMTLKISRTVPGLVGSKVWPDNERWERAWEHIWGAWQEMKRYWPGKYRGLKVV